MLEADALSCHRGGRRLFTALSFMIQPGRLLAVVGENGSGKTSLLRILCGLLPAEQGRILWQGEDVRKLMERYLASLIYIGHLNGVKDDLTPVENVMISVKLAGEKTSEGRTCEVLEAVGLARTMHRLPTRVLSQGQKRRLALARLWLSTRPLWLLDEPFTSLDAAAASYLTQRLHSHLSNGGMVVVATHQEVNLPTDSVQHLRLMG